RDDADQRAVQIRRQSESIEQRELAGAFSREVSGGVVGGNIRIVLRVPLGVIDTVQNATELIGAGAEQAVESASELGGLDLARVGFTDGGDGVGPDHAGF